MFSTYTDETRRLRRCVPLHEITGVCIFDKNFGGIVTTYSAVDKVAPHMRSKSDRWENGRRSRCNPRNFYHSGLYEVALVIRQVLWTRMHR